MGYLLTFENVVRHVYYPYIFYTVLIENINVDNHLQQKSFVIKDRPLEKWKGGECMQKKPYK